MSLQQVRTEQVKADGNSAYSHLGDQLYNAQFPSHEVFEALDGQTRIDLTRGYIPGRKQVKVFVNGTLQEAGTNYSEDAVGGTSITFAAPLAAGDLVVVRVEGAGSGLVSPRVHDHIIRERPQGAIDGVNRVFTLSHEPRVGSELVFLTGMLMDEGAANDYTISGRQITFNYEPVTGEKILVCYLRL